MAKVAFTGSTEAGRDVMARAAGTIKRVDVGTGREVRQRGLCRRRSGAGRRQRAHARCSATPDRTVARRSRILVERAVFDRFVELLVEATESITVGDPEDAGTQMGPSSPPSTEPG